MNVSKPCNICGGGTGDVFVLAQDGRALFNLGYSFDSFNGVWDQFSIWKEFGYRKTQDRYLLAAAYRLNKHIQFGISIPYLVNFSDIPGLKNKGSGIGDINLFARYELFQEFELKKEKGRSAVDNKTPYVALTFGLLLPTGKSEENAADEIDVTGKGFFMSSLGISVRKTFLRRRLQISTDLSWQHCFQKTYNQYFGEGLSSPFTKQFGERFNYSVNINYIFSSWHAVSVSASGFMQSGYRINSTEGDNSNESGLFFSASYSYYPIFPLRITPSVKWTLPVNDFGKNAPGSTTYSINFTYYIPDYNIK